MSESSRDLLSWLLASLCSKEVVRTISSSNVLVSFSWV